MYLGTQSAGSYSLMGSINSISSSGDSILSGSGTGGSGSYDLMGSISNISSAGDSILSGSGNSGTSSLTGFIDDICGNTDSLIGNASSNGSN
ncbi:MAG: hypothetical protein AB7V50_07400, partial [Vampirovibrionia bacterium]